MSTDTSELGDPLEHAESPSAGLVSRREHADGGIDRNPPPVTLVPVPRASRIFLRHGAGHGAFADLTVTAPDNRPDSVESSRHEQDL